MWEILKTWKKELTGCLILIVCWYLFIFLLKGSFWLLFNSGKDETTEEITYAVKGADGTEYESYQECCAAQDFQAAHQFLAKIENSEDSKFDLNNAKEYVFKQEALYLMSLSDEQAKKRILYLLKEEGGNNGHIDMLIDLAIENDDEDFVKTLANQIKNDSEQMLKKVMEYLSSKDSEANKTYIISLLKKHDEKSLLLNFAINNGDRELIDEYIARDLSLSNNNILNYLAATKEKKDAELIIGLLIAEEGKISKKPQIGIVKFAYIGGSESDETLFSNTCNEYKKNVENYNSLLQKVLGLAIKNKNHYLAQRVVSMFKPNIHKEDLGWINRLYTYKITADNDNINSAKSTYQEAVRSGAFK